MTISLIALTAVFFAAFGYLLCALKLNRKNIQLEQMAESAKQNLKQIAQLQEEYHNLKSHYSEQTIKLGRLDEVLKASLAEKERLALELQQNKQESQNLRTQVSQMEQQKHQTQLSLTQSQTEKSDLNKQYKEKLGSLHATETSLQELQAKYYNLDSEHTELKTSLKAREQSFKEQLELLAETKQSLGKEFESLANKILTEKGKTFSETTKAGIQTFLTPFREQVETFQKRVNEIHDASVRGNSHLSAEIKKVFDVGVQMSSEANNLAAALKGDSQQRGAWGEAQLRRTLEISGLVEKEHFSVQDSFSDAEGKRKQTDFLIRLPGDKQIIIDSKVSLLAYERAASAESEVDWEKSLAEHSKSVHRHIDDLASKDYTNVLGMHSPSFVLMFMPIEPAYIEVLKYNKNLFEYGCKKNIILVSHTTLIPILRTVSNLWMIERSNTQARQISEKAGEIYNQVCLVAERLNKLGVTLGAASNHYNSTIKALAGQQGLYGKVDRFSKLSTKVSKTLPKLGVNQSDFQTESLSLIVEELDEVNEETLPASAPTAESDQNLEKLIE